MNIRLLLIAGALIAGSLPLTHTLQAQQAAPAAEAAASESIESLIDAAMAVSKRNNVQQTEAAFAPILKHPELTPAQRHQAYTEMLRVYSLRRDWNRAEATARGILQIPNLTPLQKVEAQLALGDALRAKRSTEEALQVWQEALQSSAVEEEERATVLLRIANQLRVQRLHKEAEEVLRESMNWTGLQPATQSELLVLLGQSILDQRQNARTAEAEKILRQATFMEGLNGEQRYRAMLQLAAAINSLQNPRGTFASPVDNVYYDTWLDLAIKDYRKILELGDLSHRQQIEIHRRLADIQLEKMDIEGANQTLAEAVAIAELAPNDLALARYNQAVVFIRQLEPEKGKKILDEVIASGKLGANANEANRLIVERASLEDGIDAQIAFVQQHSADALPLLAGHYRSDWTTLIKINQVILDNTDAPVRMRWAAYSTTLSNLIRIGDLEGAKKLYAQYADDFYQQNKSYTHFSPLNQRPYARSVHERAREFMADVDLAHWLSETFADKPIPNGQKAVFYDYIINAANQERDFAKVKTYARKIVDEVPNLDVAQRLRWLATIAVIDAGNNPNKAAQAVHTMLRAEKDLAPVAYLQVLLDAGQYAMLMRHYDVAERMLKERNDLLAEETKRSLHVRFLPNGPRDISGFLNSEYFLDAKNRGVLDRRYSGNLQILMDTDTATEGREMTTEDGDVVSLDTGGSGGAGAGNRATGTASVSREYTVFTASCDDEGVYFFFYVPVEPERAKQIREGATSIGSFEITLAEGFHAPYSCFIVRGPNNATFMDSFVTQYNNRNYRNKTAKDNAKVEYRVLEDGVAMLMSFTWDAFVKIPQNGDKWYFEPIHWERGNWTWGGSRSVHWRETQGELVFENLTPENLTAIKRRLLHHAKANFLNETSSRTNGYIEIWKDNQLGDQQFYSMRVEDFHQQYLEYARRIGAEMTDEEVNEIFDAAYEAMINAKYIVAEQRYQHLLEKYTTE